MENKGEILIYQAPDSSIELRVQLDKETVWLTQAQMTALFERDRTVITKHIGNIFKEAELDEKSNVHFLHIANSDKPVATYSLDVIISVGYRVNSKRGTQFRIWATQRLKDYLVRGYALNKKRLQQLARNLGELEQTVQRIQQAGDTDALQRIIRSAMATNALVHFYLCGFWRRTSTVSKNRAN
ncbi:MAG: RhuM family protein [Saprospiraceae bacterium]|nr:RhuM family protein [Saprospiraceae bacterium]